MHICCDLNKDHTNTQMLVFFKSSLHLWTRNIQVLIEKQELWGHSLQLLDRIWIPELFHATFFLPTSPGKRRSEKEEKKTGKCGFSQLIVLHPMETYNSIPGKHKNYSSFAAQPQTILHALSQQHEDKATWKADCSSLTICMHFMERWKPMLNPHLFFQNQMCKASLRGM